MAEKSEVLVTKEEKIAEAKELFGRGSRNYCMKQYSDAADDLSSCCTIYSELYGPTAAECGEPYLVYAKALIALSKEENNLLVPEEGAEGEDDGAEDDEEGGEDEGEDEGEDGNEEEEEEKEKQSEEAGENTEKTSNENKEATKDENPTASSTSVENEPQPGPSTSNGTEQHEETEEGEDEKGGGSLQVAWEILELAVKIFEDQADKSPTNLSECYMELANISFENSNYSLAVNDYKKSLEIYGKIGEPNSRLIAEIDYKVGLCHMMLNEFPESIKFFREACAELSKVIEQEKAKEQTEETRATIKDLEETMQEIIERSREVEETTKTSIEELKRELSKIIVKTGTANGTEVPGELVSSSSSSNGVSSGSKAADKPNDISHLIKRKKPDTTETEVEGSPAKKTAVEAEEVSEGV